MLKVSSFLIGIGFLAACASDDNPSTREPGPGSIPGSGSGGTAGSGSPDVGTIPSAPAPMAEACDGPFLPMAVGNSWTYRVTDANGSSMKTSTVMAMEPVGGTGPNAATMAFHVVTTKASAAGMDRTESWQGVLDDGSVVRYRELAFQAASMVSNGEDHWDPYKLRVDASAAHTSDGASWQEMYMETKIRMGMPIEAPATTAGQSTRSMSRADRWRA